MAGEMHDPGTIALEQISRATPSGPPDHSDGPVDWVRKNLFNSPLNTILTVVLTPLILYVAYRSLRFVFVTGRWEPVDANLELFMVGQYPREERWRILAQLVLLSASMGLGLGLLRATSRSQAEETGEPFVPTTPRQLLSTYWALLVFVGVLMLAFVDTIGPWLLLGGSVAAGAVAFLVGSRVPRPLRPYALSATLLIGALSFQMLSGTYGWAWFYTAAALFPAVSATMGRLPRSAGLPLAVVGALVGVAAVVGAYAPAETILGNFSLFNIICALVGLWALYTALTGDRIDGGRLGLWMLVAVIVVFVYRAIGLEGIDWREWGGFHLNLVATVAAIVLAFPLGILLALGRRSNLPVVRILATAYIEFFRGAPLITFLLAAQFFLGFFLDTDSPLSLVTRAIAAITLFSAAYVAEIVRGGLQAVPKGQVEAGQAMGLPTAKITRLIVMPQALRAVIPAMVGQFISLFKDTSLLNIISIPEFMTVRELVHAQADFQGFGIAETLTFIAFGFWAIAFSMSRESQRLERQLGVGHR